MVSELNYVYANNINTNQYGPGLYLNVAIHKLSYNYFPQLQLPLHGKIHA